MTRATVLLAAAALAVACAAVADYDSAARDLSGERETKVHALNEENFERLTQAATGATTGPWLVAFCNAVDYECRRLKRLMPKVATTLVEESEERGRIPANVALVDVEESPWLAKRFGLSHVPAVLFFQLGVMYYYQSSSYTAEKLVNFAQSGYRSAGHSHVPPEPHVADSHERTFLIACAVVALMSGILYVVDLLLQRSRSAKRKLKAR
ncbi:hypothetical protein KFE25_009484 [Diacronema lutheri]|uniref:Thioredoxin domain-containing protein n=2 Tax=Diacronema lutheri TaxID=2081491 RepID=A0A8J5XMP3_DIALT|nr:hypothetical protein KFE25_009484 [Diacronema lutheri]